MKILVDTSVSPRIARILHAALAPAHQVFHVTDIAGKTSANEDVQEYLLANAPAAFMLMDLDVTGQPHRMDALRELQCSLIFLADTWLETKPEDQAWMILRVANRLLKRIESTDGTSRLHVMPGQNPRVRKLK